MELLAQINEVDIHCFETSHINDKFLVTYNNRFFEVSESVVELIRVLKDSSSLADATNKLSISQNKNYTEDQINTLITKCINPILQASKEKRAKTFWYEKEIISSQHISYFSNVLKLLFQPKIVAFLLLLIGIFEILFFVKQDFSYQSIGEIGIYEFVGIFLLYIMSSMFHELGHASACKKFNVEHGGIGFGIYLNFPVFYTDVSEIWKLPRKQRIAINMAGVYFQLLYTLPFIIYSLLNPDNLFFKHFVLMINFNFLITLNPFFKFDGYWMACDLMGVPNLRKRTQEYVGYIIRKVLKKPLEKKPFLLTMKSKEKIFMIIYTIIVNGFFIAYFGYFLPKFLYSFLSSFPQQAIEVITNISIGNFPPAQIFYSLISQIVFFILTIYLIYKLIRSVYNSIKRMQPSVN